MAQLKFWKIKKGHDFRIRSRHPWVFSNELLDSPKGILPGELIELTDMQGHFLARGYGNPHSLIAFRAMSFSPKEDFDMSVEFLSERIFQAWKFRHDNGFRKSFRVCYSEADQMPGLIMDRYVFAKEGKDYQVFSYQLLTSGMDVAFKKNENFLMVLKSLVEKTMNEKFHDIDFDRTFILQRNDVNVRKLEGLQVEEPTVLKGISGIALDNVKIQVQNVMQPESSIFFEVNLIEGQKTGFFLDQTFNMKLVLQHLQSRLSVIKNQKVKILDLCCYMGQWSMQIASNLKSWGVDCEVHLVDVSELALEKAKKNLQLLDIPVQTYKKDVLNLSEVEEFNSLRFDVVISDPPAFVKNKKDMHQGLAAYTKLNLQAFRLCAPGAVVASCTCSGAVSLEDFKEALRKAALKSGMNLRCLAYGGQGWDHPHLLSFPEGYYLKMALHQVT